MDRIHLAMKRMAKLVNAELVFLDRCPGWAFNKNSTLQKDFVKAFKDTFPGGIEPRVEAIHAGLECGIIIEKMGGGDAISIGPNMKDIHTPQESLDLRSMERTYKLLLNLLKM
jgi:dipeptidase D